MFIIDDGDLTLKIMTTNRTHHSSSEQASLCNEKNKFICQTLRKVFTTYLSVHVCMYVFNSSVCLPACSTALTKLHLKTNNM